MFFFIFICGTVFFSLTNSFVSEASVYIFCRSLKESRGATAFEQMKQDGNKGGIKGEDFSPKFCLLNKKHDVVAIWQKDFGTFCVCVDYFHQSCSLF